MKIVERWEDLVHTHFVTDAVRLPSARVREIERAFVPVLRAHHIVVGIHFLHREHERGIQIVLECQPSKPELQKLEAELARIIAPIPIAPPTVRTVRVEEP